MPAKISLVQHQARGTVRARVKKRAEGELQITPSDIGTCPDWIGPYGQEEWAALASHEQYSQVLSSLYRGTLIEYCVLWNRMVKTEKGETVEKEDRITGTERQMLQSLRMQLGITPASSSKVKAPAPKAKAAEPWQRLKAQ